MKRENIIRHKWKILAVCIMLAFADIGYTVFLGNFASWTEYNLSVVGGWYGHRWGLMLWGWITAVTFVSFMSLVLVVGRYMGRAAWTLEALAGIILSIAVIIPYQPPPNEGSAVSNIHITLSMIGPLCLVASMMVFIFHCICRKEKVFMIPAAILFLMMGAAALIFFSYGIITTVLEVYTVSAMTVLLTIMFLASFSKKQGI